jgi:hypothetical protein
MVRNEGKVLYENLRLKFMLSLATAERFVHYLAFGAEVFLSSKAFCTLFPSLKPLHIGGGISGLIFQGPENCPPQKHLESNYYLLSHLVGYLNGSLHCAFQTRCYTTLGSSFGWFGYFLGYLLATLIGRYSMCEIEKGVSIAADYLTNKPIKQHYNQSSQQDHQLSNPSTCCNQSTNIQSTYWDSLHQKIPLNALMLTLSLTALSPIIGEGNSIILALLLANTIAKPLFSNLESQIRDSSIKFNSANISSHER